MGRKSVARLLLLAATGQKDFKKNLLIKRIDRNSYEGIGKPEPLKALYLIYDIITLKVCKTLDKLEFFTYNLRYNSIASAVFIIDYLLVFEEIGNYQPFFSVLGWFAFRDMPL